MKTRAAVVTAGVVLAVAPAKADPVAECARFTNITHDGAIKMMGLGEALMKRPADVQQRIDLDTITSAVSSVESAVLLVRCSESVLSASELVSAKAFESRAAAWAAAKRAAVATESQFRTDVLMPICVDTRWIANARTCIAQERSNPSGVSDMARMHDCGDTIQRLQPDVDRLRPIYQASRRHAFTSWDQDPICMGMGWGNTEAER